MELDVTQYLVPGGEVLLPREKLFLDVHAVHGQVRKLDFDRKESKKVDLLQHPPIGHLHLTVWMEPSVFTLSLLMPHVRYNGFLRGCRIYLKHKACFYFIKVLHKMSTS